MFSRPTHTGRRARAVIARSITIEQLEARRLLAFSLAVNFQPAGSAVPAGTLADTGQTFADRGNGFAYGWNILNTSAARERGAHPDQRYDTLTHTQAGGDRTWEVSLPNGQYNVRIVAGDPDYYDSTYAFNAEGITALTGIPSSGTRFFDASKIITVSDGRLTLTNGANASNNKIAFIEIADAGATPPPTTAAIPGTLQAENFGNGGAGVSYYDTTSANLGGQYRDTAVDIVSASEGGYAVGYTRPGEWLNYAINVSTSGAYDLALRVASNAGGSFRISVDGQFKTGDLALPNTGGWQTWKTFNYPALTLAAGPHTLGLHFTGAVGSGDIGNVNWMQLSRTDAPTLPTVNVAATDSTAAEPSNSGRFTFTRTGSTAASLTLKYAVYGTATNGIDYNTLSGTVTIPAGSASATATVIPKDDTLSEGTETVRVTLAASAAYAIGTSAATVDIADNDTSTTPSAWPTTWTAATPALRSRWESSTVVIDNKIWTFGGWYAGASKATQSYDVYDPAANTWRNMGTAPIPHSHSAAAADAPSGIAYFAGGLYGGYPGTSSNKVWKFNARTNTWSALPAMPENHNSGGLALVNNKLHYMGGVLDDRETNTPRHIVLDLNNLAAGWKAAPDMPGARDHFSAVVLGGKIYTIGGEFGHDLGHDQQALVHRYDPATSAWTRLADLPTPKSHAEASTYITPDGKIVMAGGQVGKWISSDEVVSYDPATNRWTTLGKLPIPLQGPIVQQVGNKVIVSGGNTGSNILTKDTWIGILK